METVFITGTSSGIGHAAALCFARHGFHVIATMRNLEKSSALKEAAHREQLNIDIKTLDVNDEHSVQSVIDETIQRHKKIDILINNAGAGLLGTLEQTSIKDAQHIMNVNFFGVWRMTQAILPHMRQNKAGRIISISSIGGLIGQPFNDAYCAAKFAVEGLMESLAPVVKHFGIRVSLVEPGAVNSEFVASLLKNSQDTLAHHNDGAYKKLLDAYIHSANDRYHMAQTPEEIANVLLDVATAREPHFRYQTSAAIKELARLKLTESASSQLVALSDKALID